MRYKKADPTQIGAQLGLLDATEVPTVGEAFPGDEGVIVRPGEEGGRIPVVARWGLQPVWAKDARFGRKNAYNARAETVAEKPTFRLAFRHRRCVIPAAAFYERAEGHWLRVEPVEGAFLFAGLWEPANEATNGLPTFTMVTTEPNAAIAQVHDRMPVVLDEGSVADWLAPEAPPELLHALLAPCPAEWVRVEDAGPLAHGKKKEEEPSLF